jgi:hypothetical protein
MALKDLAKKLKRKVFGKPKKRKKAAKAARSKAASTRRKKVRAASRRRPAARKAKAGKRTVRKSASSRQRAVYQGPVPMTSSLPAAVPIAPRPSPFPSSTQTAGAVPGGGNTGS